MKIFYKDLLNFLSSKPSKELLSEKLFQLGHEHEINDDIFDMELTPNRGDCFSLLGLARDLNIFFGMNESAPVYDSEIEDLDIDFENLSPNDCPLISFLEIEIHGEVSNYSPYLENYFSVLGNNKVNFFTDISNYISYEQGQPTHCFDKSKINKKLVFEKKICDEPFLTLLDQEINLKGENCVFTHGNEIQSLAGVMGGKSSACSHGTKRVLVECAYFNPESIIGKSIKYNLNSDAAHKFERGVDPLSQNKVLRRFIKIVQEHVEIKQLKIKSFSFNEFQHIFLPIDTPKINNILGTNLEEKEYLDLINKLGFETKGNIRVPSFRSDIVSQNDLAEEIARIIGYDNIRSKPIHFKETKLNKLNKLEGIMAQLISNGFYEVINFPFTEASNSKKTIKIDNPLDSNKGSLRISLKDSLLENLLYNERRQKDSIKIFEVSDIYHDIGQVKQETRLGIIFSGRVDENYVDYSKKLDERYLYNILKIDDEEKTFFNIQEISRDGIKTKRKEKIFYIEIIVDKIPKSFFDKFELKKRHINFAKYKPISEYPLSKRDFSFSIQKIENYDEVLHCINNFEDTNLKEFFIFDFYKNHKSNEIKLGISLTFQSSIKTLSEDEIQKSISKLLMPILNIEGVSVPGLNLK